ncbi:MAG: LLM class flavin-dependent oxidoreductase [Acidothermales bacterium]|nr:LLM class flavin-dependent oxidoreductase [Acidothermales bacterium]
MVRLASTTGAFTRHARTRPPGAAATSSIRVGSGAVQFGHQTPAAVVEQFGTVDALFPGRVDLGLGRSAQRRTEAAAGADNKAPFTARPEDGERVVDGLLIPAPFRRRTAGGPTTVGGAGGVAAAARSAGARLRRAGRRHPRAARGYVPHRRRSRHPRGTRGGRGPAGVDPRQRWAERNRRR